MSTICTRAFSLTVAEPYNIFWPYDMVVERVGPYIVRLQLKILIQSPQPIVRCYRSSDSGASWLQMANFFTTIATVGTYKLQQSQVGGTGVGGFPGTNTIEADTEYWFRWQLDDGSIMPGHVTVRTWPYVALWQGYSGIGYCVTDCGFLPDGSLPLWDGKVTFNAGTHSNSFYAPSGYFIGGNLQLSNNYLTFVQCYKPGGANDPNWNLLMQCDGGATMIEAAKPVQTDILNPPQGTYIVTVDPSNLIGVGNPVTIEASV